MYVISFPLRRTVLTNGSPSDAFALNVGPEEWQYEQVARCYAAALELDARFKLFISFDMTYVPRLKLDSHPLESGPCDPRSYAPAALCLCDPFVRDSGRTYLSPTSGVGSESERLFVGGRPVISSCVD